MCVGRPKHGGHLLDHHGEPNTFRMPLDLTDFQVFKHAVDGVTEIGEFIVSGNAETSSQITARADLRNVVAEFSYARDHESLE